jgi:hypothetical protein
MAISFPLNAFHEIHHLHSGAAFAGLDQGNDLAVDEYRFTGVIDPKSADVLLHKHIGLALEFSVYVYRACIGFVYYRIDGLEGGIWIDERP